MNIYENLENLNVSEECFNDIMGIVEATINERNKENKEKKNEWEKDNATDLKIKRTLDSDTIRQLELNDPGSVKRMKEGTKKNLLGVSDIKAFRGENKKEQYKHERIGEDLIDVTQKNLKDAENKHDKYIDRIRKVLMSKKENGTLDDTTIDKGLGKVMDSKYAKKVEKARDLADKAEKLHRATHNYPDGYYYERKHKDK